MIQIEIEEWPARFGDEDKNYEYDWTPVLEEGDGEVESVLASAAGAEGFEVYDVAVDANIMTLWARGGGLEGAPFARVNLLAITTSTPPRKIGKSIKLPIRGR